MCTMYPFIEYTPDRVLINDLFAERSVGIATRPTDLSANERSVEEGSVGLLKGPWDSFLDIFRAQRSVGHFEGNTRKSAKNTIKAG